MGSGQESGHDHLVTYGNGLSHAAGRQVNLTPMMQRSTFSLLGAAVIALIASPLPVLAQAPATPVVTAPVQRGPMPLEILANGNVQAEAVVAVRARVDGQVQQIHVREGQFVKRGDPLFTLDTRLARATLAQQEAQLAAQKAAATRAASDATRYASLRGDGFAAAQRFEQAQADAAASAANVRATEALIDYTRTTIDYASITAERDGRLGSLPIPIGNYVRAADNVNLATITQMDPIFVAFSVPERWLPEIRSAMTEGPVRVTARAPTEERTPSEGRLVFIDSQVDSTTGTIQLKARFANAESRLWPGEYVNVVLVPRTEPDALSVPVQAVQTGQQGRYIYVVDGESKVHRRDVQMQRVVGGRAVVTGQVAAGDKVVVEGTQLISDGARVTERGARQAASPATPPPG